MADMAYFGNTRSNGGGSITSCFYVWFINQWNISS